MFLHTYLHIMHTHAYTIIKCKKKRLTNRGKTFHINSYNKFIYHSYINIYIFIALKIFVYLCVNGYGHSMYGEVRRQVSGVSALFPSCVSWGLNSDHQSLYKEPLSAEPFS